MAGTASEGEIRTQNGTVQQLQEQIATACFESMIAMREVLTPEQREEFASMMQERHQNTQERWGNRDKSGR